MTIFWLTLSSLYIYVTWLLVSYLKFQYGRNQIEWRVHINGIRGKSTVTRYVSAIFREAGYRTFGKTTGSAARVILPNGKDGKIERKGLPNVNEQVRILSNFARQQAEAAVVECMAINPVYAEWLENQVTRSHIGIITNVRYDHPDYLGETLEEIADSLAKTIPENGILITGEQQTNLLNILWQHAKQKNTCLIVADCDRVATEDLENFSHFVIEENVAIGYEVARILKLPQDQALKAMQTAPADPGAFSLQYLKFENHTLAWANLFAVNDRESFIEICLKLFKQLPNYQKAVLLNNRRDRPARVELFTNLAQELDFDLIATLGSYEAEVKQEISEHKHKLIELGNSTKFKNASAQEILRQITQESEQKKLLLVGAVNIHTGQAEKFINFFEEATNQEKPEKQDTYQTDQANV